MVSVVQPYFKKNFKVRRFCTSALYYVSSLRHAFQILSLNTDYGFRADRNGYLSAVVSIESCKGRTNRIPV